MRPWNRGRPRKGKPGEIQERQHSGGQQRIHVNLSALVTVFSGLLLQIFVSLKLSQNFKTKKKSHFFNHFWYGYEKRKLKYACALHILFVGPCVSTSASRCSDSGISLWGGVPLLSHESHVIAETSQLHLRFPKTVILPIRLSDEFSAFSNATWLFPTTSPTSICTERW